MRYVEIKTWRYEGLSVVKCLLKLCRDITFVGLRMGYWMR